VSPSKADFPFLSVLPELMILFYSFKRLFAQLENNDTDTIKVPAQSPFGCDVLPFAAIRRNRHIWPWQMHGSVKIEYYIPKKLTDF
jgi:hypothetical protein